jgi:hypothetical protein
MQTMEIHLLKMSLTEQDLNQVIKQNAPQDFPVEDLRVRVTPEGVYLQGIYPLFVNVNFETLWELDVQAGSLCARLSHFRALGIPANIFKSAILKILEEAVRTEPSLRLAGESLVLDLDKLLAEQGLAGRTHLRTISCQKGLLILEAGQQPR